MRLDDPADLNATATPQRNYAPYGIGADAWNGQQNVYIDTTEAPPGAAGSMAFEFNQLTGGSPGQWFSNCSHDNSLKFNEGDTFFIQFRVKYSPSLADQPILVNAAAQTVLNSPFSTQVGSNQVNVNWPGHDRLVGEKVFFSLAAPVAGINMNRICPVTTVIDGNNFTVTAPGTANAFLAGAGGMVAVYATQQKPTLDEPWRLATLGPNPFTTGAGSSTVIVHEPGHGRPVKTGLMFANATPVGGLDMNRAFWITSVIDADNYTVRHSFPASAGETGGGNTVDRIFARVTTGMKIFDIVARDVLVTDPVSGNYTSAPGYAPGEMNVGTSDWSKVVTTWGDEVLRLNLYHYYTGKSEPPLAESLPGGDVRYLTEQSQCTYFNNSFTWMDSGFCQGIVLGEWLTFQLQVTLGTATAILLGSSNIPVWFNSELKWWFAREGQPQQLMHWWRPSLSGYQHLIRRTNDNVDGSLTDFFKVNLFPFCNDKLYVQTHPLIKVNYAELIGSTSFIPDPT